MQYKHDEKQNELTVPAEQAAPRASNRGKTIISALALGAAALSFMPLFNTLVFYTGGNTALALGATLLSEAVLSAAVGESISRSLGLGSLFTGFDREKGKVIKHVNEVVADKGQSKAQRGLSDPEDRTYTRAQIIQKIAMAASTEVAEAIKKASIDIYSEQLRAKLRSGELLDDREKNKLRNEMESIQVKHDNIREKNAKVLLRDELLALYKPLELVPYKQGELNTIGSQRDNWLNLLKTTIKEAKLSGIDRNVVIRVKNELEALINSQILLDKSMQGLEDVQPERVQTSADSLRSLSIIAGDIKHRYAIDDEYRQALTANMHRAGEAFAASLNKLELTAKSGEHIDKLRNNLEQAKLRMQSYQEKVAKEPKGLQVENSHNSSKVIHGR